MPCCPLQLTASGGKRWMGQTLKWWFAQSTDGRQRWREQKNIYNQRDLTKERTVIRRTPRSSIGGVSEEEKKNSSSDKGRGRTLTLSSTTPLMILSPNDLARPLTKSSQRPSSWARFSTKFIVLGLLSLGSFTSTVKDTPQTETLQLTPSVGRTYG